jgi:hypothetical protein
MWSHHNPQTISHEYPNLEFESFHKYTRQLIFLRGKCSELWAVVELLSKFCIRFILPLTKFKQNLLIILEDSSGQK